MPTKKPPVKKDSWIKSTGRKPVMVGFLPADHAKLRIAAATAGKSMSQFVHDLTLATIQKKS
ncbi:MAG: hypothetical protein KGL39_17040 [Patescibacteria group bacterium]|nr:hypothetical protein [Patescibacteria group bacterium]